MLRRLEWLNEWCRENSAYPEVRPWNRSLPWNGTSDRNATGREEWIQSCVLALGLGAEEGWGWAVLAKIRRRWLGSRRRRVIVAVVNGFNLGGILGPLVFCMATFAEMSRRKIDWSLLVASQLVIDNVICTLALLTNAQFWLWDFILRGNMACLSAYTSTLLASIVDAMLPGPYLTSHIIIFLVTLDRIQGIVRPVDYKVHDRRRRCLLVNGIAYAAGFLTALLVAVGIHARWYAGRWSGYPGLGKPPATWQDAVCFRRLELSAQCGWPEFAHAVDTASGEVLASRSRPRYWFAYRDHPQGLCAGQRGMTTDSFGAVILVFALTAVVDVAIAVSGGALVVLFRRQQANRVRILGTSQEAQKAREQERHETAVTVAVLLEVLSAMLGTLATIGNTVYMVYYLEWRETSFTSNAIIRITATITYQMFFGSYVITGVVFRSFRKTMVDYFVPAWVPQPHSFFMALSMYLITLFVPLVLGLLAYLL